MDQTSLLEKKISKEGNYKNRDTFDRICALYEVREITLNAFRYGTFPIKEKKRKVLKILTPKQMLERLPKALAQVKAGNTSENLLNEMRQIIYSLHRAKNIAQNV